jgi:hypothetical protein
MTLKEAQIIAVRHIAQRQLPRRLDGVIVPIPAYTDEAALTFLKPEEPEITMASQRIINRAFAREVRKRGARVVFVPVDASDYFGWLGQFGSTDSPAMRAQYLLWIIAPEPKPVFAPEAN